jgi:prefoldin subunit 5
MLQDPNVEVYVEKTVKPLKKEIKKLKAEIKKLKSLCADLQIRSK